MDGWAMDKWTVLKKEGVITGSLTFYISIQYHRSIYYKWTPPINLWSRDITHNTSHSLYIDI